jgi:hypothetical protein
MGQGARAIACVELWAEQQDCGEAPDGCLDVADLLLRQRAFDSAVLAVAEPFLMTW